MRHAQHYWLRMQAEKAVDLAMNEEAMSEGFDSSAEEVVGNVIKNSDTYLPAIATVLLADSHYFAVRKAARALAEAELLHREIERRKAEGGGEP